MSGNEDAQEDDGEQEQIEEKEQNQDEKKSKVPVVGEYIYLIDQKKYAFIKTIDAEQDSLYTCKMVDPKNPSL